jgi:hypothetical protein
MSPSSFLVAATIVAACVAAPTAARASDFYARLLAGPAYFHNDSDAPTYDTSGFGLASQLDLGARFEKPFALHASLVYDTSRWMSFDSELFINSGGYETTVLGLGLGATSTWNRVTLGAVLGAQLTTHPGGNDASEGPEAAGLGPLVSATAGYTFPHVFEGVDLGVQGLARYRVGKDEYDPSGFQLGLGLSATFVAGDSAIEATATEASEAEPRAVPSVGYASAQIGWWNAELEFLSNVGLYVAAGGPWVMALLGPLDDRINIPFGARVGYQFDASEEWKLRAAAHFVGWRELQDCSLACSDYTVTWQLFEVGARHQSESGFLYGIDVPLLAIEDILRLDERAATDRHVLAPPLSIVLTQVYVGYAWPI